ncbi:hypothetical protein QBC40DRAFT_76197 [Triangularia verruculosa]|uniref:Uncharacterized protein n=1 Tax=Triangularia verruculosa TaxID=2587418 RepID=A0AAN6XI79_9PEZI|nr:hypothetical protein QBC40DRAFT_76197 [Triangularia verruculosa]
MPSALLGQRWMTLQECKTFRPVHRLDRPVTEPSPSVVVIVESAGVPDIELLPNIEGAHTAKKAKTKTSTAHRRCGKG